MGDYVESFAEVKVDYIHCSLLGTEPVILRHLVFEDLHIGNSWIFNTGVAGMESGISSLVWLRRMRYVVEIAPELPCLSCV